MIKNERQLNLSKSRLEQFKEYLSMLERKENVDPNLVLARVEETAVRGQIEELEDQIREYESLWSSHTPVPELQSFGEIPNALIRARISLGLSQKDLANLVGLKEQQIQRYEAQEYQTASLARVKELISSLDLKLLKGLELPSTGVTRRQIFEKLEKAGIDPEFVIAKIPPSDVSELLLAEDKNTPLDQVAIRFAESVAPIYHWTPDQILGEGLLQIDGSRLGRGQFKLRKNASKPRTLAYAFYAHYLALLVLQAYERAGGQRLPTDPYTLHRSIAETKQQITPYSALKYVWSLGVPVLLLGDHGGAQGSHFREGNKSVLIVGGGAGSEANLLFVLFHEFWHAAVHQDDAPKERSLTIEDFQGANLTGKGADGEEKLANRFAGAVLLGRDPNKLVRRCLDEAQLDLSRLKGAVQVVAGREKVPVDVLANVVAFRLAESGKNWWGAANNLQKPNEEMRRAAVAILAEMINPTKLTAQDLDLLRRATDLHEMKEWTK